MQVPAAPEETACGDCRGQLLAAGPVGYRGATPLCDRCLLERSESLGMVLALVSVARSFATIPEDPAEAVQEALFELGAFARIYELVAAREAPPRPFAAADEPPIDA